jgi:hypothetical protein
MRVAEKLDWKGLNISMGISIAVLQNTLIIRVSAYMPAMKYVLSAVKLSEICSTNFELGTFQHLLSLPTRHKRRLFNSERVHPVV